MILFLIVCLLISFRFKEGKSLEGFDDNKDVQEQDEEEPDEIKVRIFK